MTGHADARSTRGSIWDRKITSAERKTAVSVFGMLYIVLTGAGIWWAHRHKYGMGGFLGLIAIAFVTVWLIMLIFLIGIAVWDLVRR